MRKPYIVLVIVIILIGVGAFVWFKFLRGVWPAFGPTTQTITNYLNTNSQVVFENTNNKVVTTELPTGEPVDFPLTMPQGFSIGIFAKGIENSRVLAFDPSGTLLVSSPGLGKVFALPDRNADGIADETKVVLEGLNQPHGLALQSACQYALPKTDNDSCPSAWLYVAENDGVNRWVYDVDSMSASQRTRLFPLPSGGGHFTRTIQIGADGKLYTTVGSSCNVCKESNEQRAAMLVADADGKNLRVFSRGLRNTVFFVAHPETGEWWGTDMGRDWLGDDLPPEDVNVIRDGKHYGWPYCYGDKVHDDDFDKAKTFDCSSTESPVVKMQAHSAPLGLRFIPASWGEYSGDLLIAFHGSWNRSVPTGYKVVRVDMDGTTPGATSDFLTGFLQGSTALGRPVDLIFDKDGVLYVSDDKANVIYRVIKND